jgi:hypothetical protein
VRATATNHLYYNVGDVAGAAKAALRTYSLIVASREFTLQALSSETQAVLAEYVSPVYAPYAGADGKKIVPAELAAMRYFEYYGALGLYLEECEARTGNTPPSAAHRHIVGLADVAHLASRPGAWDLGNDRDAGFTKDGAPRFARVPCDSVGWGLYDEATATERLQTYARLPLGELTRNGVYVTGPAVDFACVKRPLEKGLTATQFAELVYPAETTVHGNRVPCCDLELAFYCGDSFPRLGRRADQVFALVKKTHPDAVRTYVPLSPSSKVVGDEEKAAAAAEDTTKAHEWVITAAGLRRIVLRAASPAQLVLEPTPSSRGWYDATGFRLAWSFVVSALTGSLVDHTADADALLKCVQRGWNARLNDSEEDELRAHLASAPGWTAPGTMQLDTQKARSLSRLRCTFVRGDRDERAYQQHTEAAKLLAHNAQAAGPTYEDVVVSPAFAATPIKVGGLIMPPDFTVLDRFATFEAWRKAQQHGAAARRDRATYASAVADLEDFVSRPSLTPDEQERVDALKRSVAEVSHMLGLALPEGLGEFPDHTGTSADCCDEPAAEGALAKEAEAPAEEAAAKEALAKEAEAPAEEAAAEEDAPTDNVGA